MAHVHPAHDIDIEMSQHHTTEQEIGRRNPPPPPPPPLPAGALPLQRASRQENTTRSRRKENKDKDKSKRSKYIIRACQDCQRRKVKCSGEDACFHCRARGIQCVYLPKSDHATVGSSRNRVSDERIGADGRRRSLSNDNSNLSLDERISLLQEEVKRVANRHLGDQQRIQDLDSERSRRFTVSSSVQYTIDLPQGLGDETDTFNLSHVDCKDLSLSSQLLALQELLGPKPGPQKLPHKLSGPSRIFPLELPRPSRLHYLLDVYYREMDGVFPFLDQVDIQERISQALEALGYSEYDLIIDVDVQHHAIVAVLCNMLVMAECLDPDGIDAHDSRPGWPMYVRGRKLLQQCSALKVIDLDLVRYHTLSALYMMNSELLQSASHAISTAIQIAMAARLNDQSAWGGCSSEEQASRQKLWWTIYFLDRRLAQRNGTPYLIRENEVAVEKFEPKSTMNRRVEAEHFNDQDDQDKWLDSNYFQFLVNFSKLWGQIWDTFFAAAAPKRGDWEEIEITDTRILLVRLQLPSKLTWDTALVNTYIANGETEPQIRRRVSITIRINLLRMIIRQNPLLSSECGEHGRQFCAEIAKSSIEAIAAFTNVCPRIRSSGYFISTALVECIYHLVYILEDSTSHIDRPAALESLRRAYQLLVDFANTWITARRALQALGSAVFARDGGPDSFFEAMSEKTDQSERMESPRDDVMASQKGQSPVRPISLSNFSPRAMAISTSTMTQLSNQIIQLESQHQQFGYHSDSGFIQDLANSYGDLDFDCSQMIFGRV